MPRNDYKTNVLYLQPTLSIINGVGGLSHGDTLPPAPFGDLRRGPSAGTKSPMGMICFANATSASGGAPCVYASRGVV